MSSPTLKGRLATDVLLAAIKPTTVFDADSHIWIRPSEHELVIHSTDNARVAWADIILQEDAFQRVSWEATETGIDLNRIAAITDKVIDSSATSLLTDETSQQLSLKSDEVTLSKSRVVPSHVPRVLDPPEYDRPAEVILLSDTLDPVITLANDLADYLRIGVDSDNNTVYASAEGDKDSVCLVCERSDVIDLQPADVESVFALEYLKGMQNVLPDETNIRFVLGDMVPAVIQYPIAGGDGSVTFTLRPIVRAL